MIAKYKEINRGVRLCTAAPPYPAPTPATFPPGTQNFENEEEFKKVFL